MSKSNACWKCYQVSCSQDVINILEYFGLLEVGCFSDTEESPCTDTFSLLPILQTAKVTTRHTDNRNGSMLGPDASRNNVCRRSDAPFPSSVPAPIIITSVGIVVRDFFSTHKKSHCFPSFTDHHLYHQATTHQSVNMSKEDRMAVLHWSSTNAQPCYCIDPYPLDTCRISATPETVANLFAISNKDTITVTEVGGKNEVELVDGSWPLEAQKEYTVSTTDSMEGVVRIKKMFALFPGKDEDEKTDRIHALSKNFYSKIWHGKDTPEDFKKTFISRVSTDEIQAYRQFNWFLEVFGGPSMFEEEGRGEKHYLPRTMAKHTSSRMTMEHSVTWLKLMRQALEEEFPEDPQVKKALGIYWLHFYAMFPFSDEERQEFRRVILDDTEDDVVVQCCDEVEKGMEQLNVEERVREGTPGMTAP